MFQLRGCRGCLGSEMEPHQAPDNNCPRNPRDSEGLSAWVMQRGRSLGFAAVGICDASPSSRGAALHAWLQGHKHGAMEWMSSNIEVRLDPTKLVAGAQSIVVVADRYHDGQPDRRPAVITDESTGAVSAAGRTARYARGRDYHRRIKKRLRRMQREMESVLVECRGKVCCDIEPLMEREMAERAGLGRCGKHTLLILPRLGSWVLLACYVTTVRLRATDPIAGLAEDPCGSCTRCIDACPTQAITPWSVDGSKCISAVTIENREWVDPAIASKAGDWIFGCDICQEVCPHNQPTRVSRRIGFHHEYDGRNGSFSLVDVLGWDELKRRAAFGPSALNRVQAAHARRNAVWCALEVLERTDDPTLEQMIRAIAADVDESPVVRHAAQTVVARLEG